MAELRADASCSTTEYVAEHIEALLKKMDWFKGGKFVQSYGDLGEPTNLPTPIIAYQATRRPAQMGARELEIKQRQRKVVERPDGTQVQVWSQSFDCTFHFEVWGDSNKVANYTTHRFELMLSEYAGHLMRKGVQQCIFQEYGENPPRPQQIPPHWSGRYVNFLIRIERSITIETPVLNTVDVDVVDPDKTQ